MIKRVLCLITAILTVCTATGYAAEVYDVVYKKHGGGQYIYCNNPEFVTATDLSTVENPDAAYMMNNTALKPGKYSLFFCFVNWTDFNVEPDVEFKSSQAATVTIDSIGYYVPQSAEYWDCIGAWADLMDIDIRPTNGTEQYIHYSGKRNIPAEIRLDNSNDWASRYIYNYEALVPKTTFNMLINFTVESGEVDVNCAALRQYNELGDRSMHNPDAKRGRYVNDSTIKGIDTETLPIVEAELDIEITPETPNGKDMSVRVYNQFYPDGNIVPLWTTNINPVRDASALCKSTAAGSDMLTFTYEDDEKLKYYGENVPEEERDNIWRMDIYHCDSLEYNPTMPWNAADYRPNSFTAEAFDKDNTPIPTWQFNIGNFGVVNRHNFRITNTDTVERTLNYFIKSACSCNIVIVRDSEGNVLNPYTLTRENPYALSKAITDATVEDCMFSAAVPPGETREYIVDVILPANAYGGQQNILRADNHKLLEYREATEFPVYSAPNELKDVFYTGAEYMKWSGNRLLSYADGEWQEVKLPGATRDLFASMDHEVSMVKTDSGYAARYSAWDRFPDWKIGGKEVRNEVYFLDNTLEYLYSLKFPDYIYSLSHSNHTLFVQSDGYYGSEDNTYRSFSKLDDFALPVSNGKYMLSRQNWQLWRSSGGSSKRICFEGEVPPLMYSSGGIFYYKKEYQEYVTDTQKKNILAVSPDGVSWYEYELPAYLLELVKVYNLDGRIYVGTKYETIELEDIPQSAPVIMHDGEYLAFNTLPEIKNGTLTVPMDFILKRLGAKAVWMSAGSVKITKGEHEILLRFGSRYADIDGRQEKLGCAPYVKENQLMLPLRSIASELGCRVRWDEKTNIASVESAAE